MIMMPPPMIYTEKNNRIRMTGRYTTVLKYMNYYMHNVNAGEEC